MSNRGSVTNPTKAEWETSDPPCQLQDAEEDIEKHVLVKSKKRNIEICSINRKSRGRPQNIRSNQKLQLPLLKPAEDNTLPVANLTRSAFESAFLNSLYENDETENTRVSPDIIIPDSSNVDSKDEIPHMSKDLQKIILKERHLNNNFKPNLTLKLDPHKEEIQNSSMNFEDDDFDIKMDLHSEEEDHTFINDTQIPNNNIIIPNTSNSNTIKTEYLFVDTPITNNDKAVKKVKNEKHSAFSFFTCTDPDVVEYSKEQDQIEELEQFISSLSQKFHENCHGVFRGSTFRTLVLNTYFSCPTIYRMLSEKLELKNITNFKLSHFNITSGIAETIVQCLKTKYLHLPESYKQCVISMAEVKLRPHLYYLINKDFIVGLPDMASQSMPAGKALVVMAHGVHFKWEQPLGFYFLPDSKYCDCSSALYKLFMNIMDMVYSIGYKVTAVTLDYTPELVTVTQLYGMSIEQPWINLTHDKVSCHFDVLEILRVLRNDWIHNDIIYITEDVVKLKASWKDIEMMYAIDSKRSEPVASHLTNAHINREEIERTHIQHVADIFSHSVLLSMDLSMQEGKLSSTAIATYKFLSLLCEIYCMFYSSMFENLMEHNETVLKQILDIIPTLKIVNNGEIVYPEWAKYLEACVNTVLLQKSYTRERGGKPFFSQKLSLAPLRKIITAIENEKGKPSVIPTALRVYKVLRPKIVRNLVRYPKVKFTYTRFRRVKKYLNQIFDNATGVDTYIMHIPYNMPFYLDGKADYQFPLSKQDPFEQMCVYLLKSCYTVHSKCLATYEYIHYQFHIRKREFNDKVCWEQFGRMREDAGTFKDFVRQMENVAVEHFGNNFSHNVGHQLWYKIRQIYFITPCKCFPLKHLMQLFIRFRTYQTVSYYNKHYRKGITIIIDGNIFEIDNLVTV